MRRRITAITLENFKAVSTPIRIELAPITLLFGQNSVGKSTVIQALHYLRELLENENVDPDMSFRAGKAFDLGGFESIVNRHDLSKTIKIRVDFVFGFSDLEKYSSGSKPLISSCLPETEGIGKHLGFEFLLRESSRESYIEIEIAYSSEIKRPYIKKFISGFFGKKVAEIVYLPPSISRFIYNSGILQYVAFDHEIFCRSKKFAPGSFLKNIVKDILPERFIAGENDSGLLLSGCTGFPTHWDALNISEGYFKAFAGIIGSNVAGVDSDIRLEENDLKAIYTFESYMTQLTKGPCEILLSMLKDMVYVGPLRIMPERNFIPKKSYDPSRWSNGLAAWDKLYQGDQEFIDGLNYWLADKERLNTNYKVELRRYRELNSSDDFWDILTPDSKPADISTALKSLKNISEKSELSLLDHRQNCTVHFRDVGIGISQIMPVLVCALDNNVSIAAIEQPELHIHPGLQCHLADLLIYAAIPQPDTRENSVNKKIASMSKEFPTELTELLIIDTHKMFLIETHSEHILLRLLRRIRETTEETLPDWQVGLHPEDVSANFIEFSNGKYNVRFLHISKDGDSLGEWPEGFFEERAGELF